jgi:hypothetical protein
VQQAVQAVQPQDVQASREPLPLPDGESAGARATHGVRGERASAGPARQMFDAPSVFAPASPGNNTNLHHKATFRGTRDPVIPPPARGRSVAAAALAVGRLVGSPHVATAAAAGFSAAVAAYRLSARFPPALPSMAMV